MMEGNSIGALYSEAIRRNFLTRLDHAAYLGRELARAEQSILQGTSFVQDAAPGETGNTVTSGLSGVIVLGNNRLVGRVH